MRTAWCIAQSRRPALICRSLLGDARSLCLQVLLMLLSALFPCACVGSYPHVYKHLHRADGRFRGYTTPAGNVPEQHRSHCLLWCNCCSLSAGLTLTMPSNGHQALSGAIHVVWQPALWQLKRDRSPGTFPTLGGRYQAKPWKAGRIDVTAWARAQATVGLCAHLAGFHACILPIGGKRQRCLLRAHYSGTADGSTCSRKFSSLEIGVGPNASGISNNFNCNGLVGLPHLSEGTCMGCDASP